MSEPNAEMAVSDSGRIVGLFVIIRGRVYGVRFTADDRPDCHWLVRDLIVEYAWRQVLR
jgi:hypothetical protein